MKAHNVAKMWIDEINIYENSIITNRSAPVQSRIMDDIILDPTAAWEVIKEISSLVNDEWAMDNFSSGILSSFVIHQGREFKREIREMYFGNDNFRALYDKVIFEEEALNIILK